jgi:hypothetical protein
MTRKRIKGGRWVPTSLRFAKTCLRDENVIRENVARKLTIELRNSTIRTNTKRSFALHTSTALENASTETSVLLLILTLRFL